MDADCCSGTHKLQNHIGGGDLIVSDSYSNIGKTLFMPEYL